MTEEGGAFGLFFSAYVFGRVVGWFAILYTYLNSFLELKLTIGQNVFRMFQNICGSFFTGSRYDPRHPSFSIV